MEIYTIEQKKVFMSKLLKHDLFDDFEVREAIIHTSFKSILEGKRNAEFFSDVETPETPFLSSFLTWAEMRPYVYHLILGNKLPTYFKIVLSTNGQVAASLSALASTFFLNITFKDNVMTCSTGIAYKTFSLDKTPEHVWDEKVKQFLFEHGFL